MKKKWFMLKKLWRDISHPRKRYAIAEDLTSARLGYYYFKFEENRLAAGKDQALIRKFDENGIPLNKTYIDVTDKEYVYFPISIGQMGLSVFHTWLQSGKDADKLRFLKFADWFYGNGQRDERCGVRWLTHVALPQYGNPGPWASAFSQGRGISLLLRAFQLTGNQNYARMAEDALKSFLVPVRDGGVTSFVDGFPFYEEYTSDDPVMVLNGHIFALFGIYDFLRVYPQNETAQKIWQEGIDSLLHFLPEFDMGWWTRYNLCRVKGYPPMDPATIFYHNLHISQLEVLYRITGTDDFKNWIDRWEKYLMIPNMLRSYVVKYKALKGLRRV